MLTNQTLLQKADLALADISTGNGLLQPEQAQKFLRLLIQEAKVMQMATVTGMKSQKKFINKIKFGSRILHAGTPGRPLSLGDRSTPTFTSAELDTKLFKAEVRLQNEELEDSIERGELRQTIMTLMAEHIATDMDEVIINGDTTSSDTFLAQIDGLIKQIVSNTYDHGANTANRALFKALLKTMPNQYLRNKKNLAFLTSVNADIDYRDSLADRATANIGDKFVMEDAPAMYSGVPVVPVPMFLETLGTASQCTDAILIDPKNINVGIWRDITVETDKLVSDGVLIIVATLRFDMKLAEETASVKAINVHTHV